MQNIIFVASPNFDSRPANSIIDHVILHYTEIPFDETIAKFSNPEEIVSAHYVIAEDGVIFSCVQDHSRARHAGSSRFRGRTNFNDFSIGIEIVNSGKEQFSAAQMQSCIDLCLFLKEKYQIPAENFLGHSDIAPSRKIDPGIFFEWSLLSKYDLGIICSRLYGHGLDEILFSKGDASEGVADLQKRLQKFGYEIDITGLFDKQTSDVVRAFQSHFSKQSITDRKNLDYHNFDSYFVWDKRSDYLLKCYR